MVARGYCLERVAGRKRFYQATDPFTLKETLRRQFEQEHEEKQQRLQQNESQKRSQLEQEHEQKQLHLKMEIEQRQAQLAQEAEQKRSRLDLEIEQRRVQLEKEFDQKRSRLQQEIDQKSAQLQQESDQKEEQLRQDRELKIAQFVQGIEQKRQDLQQEAKERNSLLESRDDLFKTLDDLNHKGEENDSSIDKVEVIRNIFQVHLRYVEMFGGAKKEILAFARSPYASSHSDEMLDEQGQALTSSIRKGVKVQTIIMYEPEFWKLERFRHFVNIGENIRACDSLSVKMVIVDRAKVMFGLPSVPGDIRSDFTMMIVDDPGYIKMCVEMFNYEWERSLPLEDWVQKLNSRESVNR